jgi:hypothetical protein
MSPSRRKQSGILDDLLRHLKTAPAWEGPLVVGIVFAVLRWVIPFALKIGTDNEGKQAMTNVLATFSAGIATYAVGVVLFVWVFAEILKRIGRTENTAEVEHCKNGDPISNPTGTAEAVCPKCGAAMVIRTAKKGSRAGSQFLGCRHFPACNGTREIT